MILRVQLTLADGGLAVEAQDYPGVPSAGHVILWAGAQYEVLNEPVKWRRDGFRDDAEGRPVPTWTLSVPVRDVTPVKSVPASANVQPSPVPARPAAPKKTNSRGGRKSNEG
jgi:hypothetical protein